MCTICMVKGQNCERISMETVKLQVGALDCRRMLFTWTPGVLVGSFVKEHWTAVPRCICGPALLKVRGDDDDDGGDAHEDEDFNVPHPKVKWQNLFACSCHSPQATKFSIHQ